jgi:hypothetical protein
VVDGRSLENFRTRKGTVGSNPTFSAKLKGRKMKRVITLVIGALICGLGIGVVFADSGPSPSDLRAAMNYAGIRSGASVDLKGKTYTLHNISVSKTGPETFIVSLQTVPAK